jgi:hypothetical protein
MDWLDPEIFKRMFRVDRASFSVVLELIEPFMVHGEMEQAKSHKQLRMSHIHENVACCYFEVACGTFRYLLCLWCGKFHFFQ